MTGNTPISDETDNRTLGEFIDDWTLTHVGRSLGYAASSSLADEVTARLVPLLVSAEADRDEAQMEYADALRTIEGLRAELAERDATIARSAEGWSKLSAELAALAPSEEWADHFQQGFVKGATRAVPWPRLSASLTARLRCGLLVGGDERPGRDGSAAQPGRDASPLRVWGNGDGRDALRRPRRSAVGVQRLVPNPRGRAAGSRHPLNRSPGRPAMIADYELRRIMESHPGTTLALISAELLDVRPAAGRPAEQPAELGDGGQEKPSGEKLGKLAERFVKLTKGQPDAGSLWRDLVNLLHPAAPVGGQHVSAGSAVEAEPSDAQCDCPSPGSGITWSRLCPVHSPAAAAAVSGEQATPPSGNQR